MAIDVVAEEVATNLEEIAEVTRRISSKGVGIFLGGLVVGVGVGFYLGHRWNKEKLRVEAFKESEQEVEQIRASYLAKAKVAEAKPNLEEVVEVLGYKESHLVTPTPVAMPERMLPAPVPVREMPVHEPVVETPIVPHVAPTHTRPQDRNWSYPKELEARTPDRPYVIHQDEFNENTHEYDHMTYTYYEADDVLVDEADNQPVPHPDLVVGQDNLKFGYGTDDPDVVFVRNDRLGQEMEICRTEGSYEEDVLGLNRDEPA